MPRAERPDGCWQKETEMETTPKTPEPQQWLTIAEVCTYLSVPRSTLDKWRKEGRGPRIKKLPNGQVRIRHDWLDAWINELPEAA
jgi:excisionase family DNA binding protein